MGLFVGVTELVDYILAMNETEKLVACATTETLLV